MFTPVIVWNASHEWASLLFQTKQRAAESLSFSLDELAIGALLMVTPVGIAATWSALRRDPSRERDFTAALVLVPLGVFALNSLVHSTRVHWTGPVWIGAVPLIAARIADGSSWSLRPRTWRLTSVAVLALAAWSLAFVALDLPGVPPGSRQSIPMSWSALARRVEVEALEIECATKHELVLVGMDKHFLASELSFYGARDDVTSRHLFGRRGFMFEEWAPASRFDGRDLLAVSLAPALLDDAALAPRASELGPLRELELEKDGRAVGAVFVREVRGYRAPR
jgi:dolichol-phosphate mannosyltransferase